MLELNGIYHTNTINYLQSVGVNSFNFDCRPKSFNFVQLHLIEDIINAVSSDIIFGIILDHEQKLGIERIYNSIHKATGKNHLLYIYGNNEKEYFDELEWDFFWKFNSLYNFNHLYDNKNFKGFIVSIEDLNPLGAFDKKLEFLKTLSKEKYSIKLQLDWDSEVERSLLDFYDFDGIIFEINSKVEKSFRNIDDYLVKTHLANTIEALK